MTISGLFIKRPIMTTLVMTGILLFGIMGYRLLPPSDLGIGGTGAGECAGSSLPAADS